MSKRSTGRRWVGSFSNITGYIMVYGYIAIFLLWGGLIAFTGFRTEGLTEGILAAVFLVGPGLAALVIKAREDLAGVTRAGLGGTQSEVAEDYTRGEMGGASDGDEDRPSQDSG